MRLSCWLFVLLFLAAFNLSSARAETAPIVLVDAGQPRAAIVIPSGRDPKTDSWIMHVERQTALFLQGNLAQMSGAKLPIIDEAALGSVRIEGGRIIAESPKITAKVFVVVGQGTLAEKLGVNTEGLTPGGFRIRTTPNTLVLLGHPTLSHPRDDGGGLRQAAVKLLESMGCRYLWPGETGKVIPQRSTISIASIDRSDNPIIGQRRLRPIGAFDAYPQSLTWLQISVDAARQAYLAGDDTRASELADRVHELPGDFSWTQWHGLGGDLGLTGGHAFGKAWERWGKDHPEWFALQADGTRDQSAAGSRSRMCNSNLELIQAIADDVLEQARNNPAQKCISIDDNDGGYSSFCMCDNCKKLDPPDAPKIKFQVFQKVGAAHRKEIDYPSLSDRYVWFWNQIAQRVTAQRPDLRLGVSAYSFYSTAPIREKLHPSLVLRFVPHELDEWEGWRKAGATTVYWRPNIFHSRGRTGDLRVMVRLLTRTFSTLADSGMLAVDIDSVLGHWSTQGINYFAAAKLCWNPKLTYEQIIDDYCTAGFASAAEPVKQYFMRAEELTTNAQGAYQVPTPEVITELRGLLAQADRAAGGDAAVRARIDFLRMGLNYTDLVITLTRVNDDTLARKPVDKPYVNRLRELVYLGARDMLLHNPNAVNFTWVGRGTGYFALWEAAGVRNYQSPMPLIIKIEESGRHLTGRENSLNDMLAALGLNDASLAPASAAPAKTPGQSKAPVKTEVDADETGRAIEVPAR